MKERLTGAIILVAVLVLLVPELLSGPGGGTSTKPAVAESSASLRSYTIDLADDASRRATAPTSTPALATDEPVTAATPEPDVAGTDEGAAALPASPQTASGNASRDPNKVDGNAGGSSPSASSSVEDDQPRSAFGPNAVQRPKPPSDAPSGSPRGADSAASARSAGAPSGSKSTRDAASEGSSGRAAANAESSRPAATTGAKKGWAVQLGVFASRDNADRLAKQVKGKGYTVSVNETTGNGKRLYRVRVGPEPSRPAAVELGAKLRAAGHPGSVVALP